MLQTRNGKRTARAALKIACDLVEEGMISTDEALLKIEPKQLDALLHPTFDEKVIKKAKPVAKGLPASPGAACGKIAFSAEEAVERANKGEKVVLVRLETSPEDIEGMYAAEGILTARGGMTSHAAVVARGMGACCVAGCQELVVNEAEKKLIIGGKTYTQNDFISIDGIGLCRTEHMFFAEDRIPAMREMIVSKNEDERRRALNKLLPMQRADFIGLYEAMGDRPVTIRFLDPPLHEFVPHKDSEIQALAKEMGLKFEDLKKTIDELHEMNPMLGHRGCRLSITYPEIAEMQTQAVIEAAIEINTKKGGNIVPEIMIPLVGDVKELKYFMVGTMIEIPRAAITADEIAQEAEFFSFGTNDLTQMTFGFSRDDAGKFLEEYYSRKIFESDPFAKLDQTGVGKLVELAIQNGKKTRPNIKLGICGEHGGDPSTIEFCHNVGLNYVSCSPFRVPIARLAAAQANIKNPRK